MRKSEYGSDFVEKEPITAKKGMFQGECIHDYLLGRTALDAIVQDAIMEYGIKTVLLPSYCCHTMIHPFVKRGLQIRFYDIVPAKGGGIRYCIDWEQHFDALLIMQYFGFHQEDVFDIIDRLKDKKKVIIEDATHSLLQPNPYSRKSNYVFASYRKWMATNGGAIVIKREGWMREGADIVTDEQDIRDRYLAVKTKAIAEKKQYFTEKCNTEKTYRQFFHEAEQIIETQYAGFEIDNESRECIYNTDYERMKIIRQTNAKYLVEGLRAVPQIHLLFHDVTDKDVPLFVPICMETTKRQSLRQYLIEHNIFLPIHWPLSELHNITEKGKQLFENELSIICDQRYDIEDMDYIISMIKRWENAYE
ncbi:MAG: hypothetical protein NC251_02675 [Lachnoclostridium sp.]|nr:hypothetical protein [Lachnospira sp.]MCM1247316.1 hypothetical protein [Lachnoclostridium sp.]MCM1534381.1 hypothetical protein [Clostridium sp.]